MSNNKKILIADDEELIVDYLKDLLTDLGYQTVAATNGKETIDTVSSERPDLILLDNGMPDMKGFEVCSAIRSKSENTFIPIIMLTGDATEDSVTNALEKGVDDYITKPFKDDELITKINYFLPQTEKDSLPS